MARFLICITLFINISFGAIAEEYFWEKGETFLNFLERNKLPLSIYYSLDNEDKEVASEIYSGIKYYILKEENGDVKQILIPVGGGELQVHIYRESEGNYTLGLTPVAYQEERKELAFELKSIPSQDIISYTGSNFLANEFANSFRGSVDFRSLRPGTEMVMIYKQRTRLGSSFNVVIEGAMVNVRGKKEYIFFYEPKGRYYNNDAKEIEGFFLMTPLQYTRISSPFTLKRWHPVLKKYRAHLGIDYAAPMGTQVKSAGDGRVTFVGNKNGYGKTVIVSHEGGYSTLYAHLNGFASSAKSGASVKKGQLIAYVGNTGVSTGPHLHFGLYKNNQPINPSSVIKIAKSALSGKEKTEFFEYAESMRASIEAVLSEKKVPKRDEPFVYSQEIAAK